MPRYFFDIIDGRRLVDLSGLDCLNDADAISKGETMARQIEADGSVDMDPQRHVAAINEEGQLIGKFALGCAPGSLAEKVLV
jgi:hypothetical protein